MAYSWSFNRRAFIGDVLAQREAQGLTLEEAIGISDVVNYLPRSSGQRGDVQAIIHIDQYVSICNRLGLDPGYYFTFKQER